MKHFTLSFFGTFQAKMGDTPLTNFRSAKIQGLLIYLVLSPQQAHDRDVLTALFWPDEPEAVAKQNFRQSLYRLRKLLGDIDSPLPPYLLIERTTVQFNAAMEYSLDVADFLSSLEKDQLERAVSLYQGELLPSFSCDSLPFDEWLRHERQRLHRLALDALFKLTAHNLAQADYPTAQKLARQQLTLESWREEAHQQLIQALALQGQRSAAIAQYEACRAILAEELGIEPGTETKNLLAQLHNQPAKHPATQTSAAQASKLPAQHLSIPFVGRKTEYAALVAAYQRASSNGGLQLVTLAGNAGIGKTRLTEQFLAWATLQGADVLQSRAFETSGGLSYQPITHLLRQRLERENAPEDLLADLWLSQLTRLLPELRERYPDLPEPTQEEATAKQHLFEAITRLGQALAARAPLVLFVDDWHWADAASLDVLYYAAMRWAEEKMPILLLLTLRQEAVVANPAMNNWLAHLKRAMATTQLQLHKLSQSETEQLIRTLLASESGNQAGAPDGQRESLITQFCQWLFKETDGQPLFLTETLKTLVEDDFVQPNATGTAWQIRWSTLDEPAVSGRVLHGIRQIIQNWLARITPHANALLMAVAVLAQHATFDHLCRVAGLEETQALTALDELLRKQLLLETKERFAETASRLGRDPIYGFSHQKVSEVVYAEAGTARQRILHRQVFTTLQASAAPSAALAHHALHAGLLAETIYTSLVAGNEAMAIFAVQVAIHHYQTAWQIAKQRGWPEAISGADRQALYVGLGRAYELIDDWPKARDIYQGMIGYAQTVGVATLECLGLNLLAAVYLNGLSEPQKALTLLEQARKMAEQSGDQRGLAETEWNLSIVAIQEQKTNLALHHSEQALALARQLGHPQLLARCLNSLSMVNSQLRHWDMVELYATEACQLYTAAGNQVLAADSQRLVGFGQMFSGQPRASLTTLQETLAFSQQIENLWGQADCAWKLAHTSLELGHYDAAIRLGRQAVQQTRTVGPPFMGVLARLTWGIVQRTIMALDAAQETQLALLMDFTGQGVMGWVDLAPAELCALHAVVGDWGQALGYARQSLMFRGNEPFLPVGLSGWYETEALLRGGDADLARAEVARQGKIMGNNKRYRLPLLRSQAVLAQWDGDADQAITHLQAALALAQEIGLPGEEWPILGALGGLYAGRGEQAKAQQTYKAASVIIHRLAGTIDEAGLREGFLTAVPVRSVLAMSEFEFARDAHTAGVVS